MGTKIHMHIIDKNGTILHPNLINVQNWLWYEELSGKMDREEYEYLPKTSEISPQIMSALSALDENFPSDYFGGACISVVDYLKWFKRYQPHIDAGWISKYDEFYYNEKHIYPMEVFSRLTPEMLNENADWVFTKLVDEEDPAYLLYITLNSKLDLWINAYIVYYFEN